MRKFFILSLVCSSALAVNDGDTWAGSFSENKIDLNDGENLEVILQRDPSFQDNRGNNFGYLGGTNLEYSTNLGNSTLILTKDPNTNTASGKDMSYYHNAGQKIIVNERSHLIMNLNSQGSSGGFIVNGSIVANGGVIDIKNITALDMQKNASVVVQNGGTLNISNVSRLIMTSTNNSPTLKNDGGIINIMSDLYNYNKQASVYTRPVNGGYFLQNSGITTITGSFYSAGFYNAVKDGSREDALVEIKGGIFEVNGSFENGKNDTSAYLDYYGIGKLVATGNSEIKVGGDFISDAQGSALSGGASIYRSMVDLQDATLRVGNSFKAYRSDISLTGLSSIYAKDFLLDSSATINFIGSGNGFGLINASNSATFDGAVNFILDGSLVQNSDKVYVVLETPNLNGNGLKEGILDVYGSSGGLIGNTEIVKVDNKYYLTFDGAKPPSDSQTSGSSGVDGNEGENQNGGSAGDDEGSEDEGSSGIGDSANVGGEEDSDLGNEGSDNLEGNGDSSSGNIGNDNQENDFDSGSEESEDLDQKVDSQPSDNSIYNAIYGALVGEGGIIDDEVTLHRVTQTIQKQLDHIKEGPKTHQGSIMHHNMLGRIAQTTRTQYAFHSQQKYAAIAGDYIRIPYFEKEETKNNVYANVLAGYSHYKDSNTLDYGINFGYDKMMREDFFGGIYGSVSKRNMKADNMDLSGYSYNVGLYGRSHLTEAVELDMLGYYTNSQSKYTRTFAGVGNNKASYDVHNIGLQARFGYRVKFDGGHSLKPYIGLFGSYYHMPLYKENGNVLPITRRANNFTNLYGALGVEYRKVNENGGSFFIALEGAKGKPIFGNKDYEVKMGVSTIRYQNKEEFLVLFLLELICLLIKAGI